MPFSPPSLLRVDSSLKTPAPRLVFFLPLISGRFVDLLFQARAFSNLLIKMMGFSSDPSDKFSHLGMFLEVRRVIEFAS